MSCEGLGFMATRSEVNRWREPRPTEIPLTLMLFVSEYATRLLIHKLSLNDKVETADLNHIYRLHHPKERTCFLAGRGSVSKQPPFDAESCFFRTSNPIPLVKSCCHSDSLTGWEGRSLSLDVVNVSWLNEWGNVTAETFDLVHYTPQPTFPGTWNSAPAESLLCQGADLCDWSTSSWVLWQWGRSTSSTWFS